ncbi:UPF0695 membrane protein [Sphaceloma murrayae]|uniref:UPF0695 membrane protein n=1 Tax=Sphaceloma murrayae TaxID=2082308 RepID=A0A2K1QWI9_9PEZI|nr:UPF0695 membrane protein [Sphaceloma murrayae]
MNGMDELRAPPPIPHTDDASASSAPGHPSTQLHLEDQATDLEDSNSIPDESNTGVDKSGNARAPPRTKKARSLSELYIICHLIFFSLLGTLARLGVQWLTFYPGAPITTSVLWANVGGSYIMGFLSEDRQLFQLPASHQKPNMSTEDAKTQHSKYKKTIPLYIGLATGFCGSFTSFSSFIRDAFLALSNDLPSPLFHPVPAGTPAPDFTHAHTRNGGYSVLAVLAVLIYEPGLSLCALNVGAHTALLLERTVPSISRRANHLIDLLIIPLGLGTWLAAVLVAIFPSNTSWRGEVLFALVFAPLGTLLRFYVSAKLNPRIKSFPLGTFAVNMFGTVILGMSYDLQRSRIGGIVGGSVAGCQILQGIEDGA